MLAEGKTFLLRMAIFVGLASVVTTIIYFTPVPDIDFASCERPCHELEWPMICRVKLTVEMYQTLSRWCGDCPKNSTDCFRKHCVSADGYQQGLLTVNRQFPGPTINVCENDILVVDVVNRVPGHEMSIHWRGQSQRETPVMDGVPMVTQCPIPSHTTFQYKFRASQAGTHLWHAFTGSKTTETLFGALVVRQPDSKEPHLRLYDTDNNVVVISEWRHGLSLSNLYEGDLEESASPGTLLVNGRGQQEGDAVRTPLTTYEVEPERKHRFRVAHAGGGNNCPLKFTVDQHSLKLIALDGSAVEPRDISSLVLAPGERADFVLHANQPVAAYWLRIATSEGCGSTVLHGAAVVRYKGAESSVPQESVEENLVDKHTKPGMSLLGAYDQRCAAGEDNTVMCSTDVVALQRLSEDLTIPKADTTLYIPFGYNMVPIENLTSPLLSSSRTNHVRVPHINNLTFMLPSSPLLFELAEVDSELPCNQDYLPARCRDPHNGGFCQCTHIMNIPLGNAVELVLINQGGGEEGSDNVFHLHGYSFHLLGVTQLEHPPTVADVQSLDRRGALITRNFNNPVLKDTVLVPKNGVAVLRFKANNPGLWLLHDQRLMHWSAGLAALLHVGKWSDTPPVPSDFPRCGSWVGPQFFLI
ncbi:uncharacterized protein [Anabrus simplex]|uniref:uncharacterized protein n=1 Tax=Anabrus simplex TaxID=316456 RepID=UPI0035A2F1C3